jgi:repressor LexA
MSQKQPLTPRQEEILSWVKDFIRDHGMPPTVREIGAAFGIKSSSA